MKAKKLTALALSLTFAASAVFTAPAYAADDTTAEIGYTVTYKQTEARTILDYVNDLRTGDDAWYWDSDDETVITCEGLSELTYDYDLEAIAMQRAAEIAIYYSHTRPDGSKFSTAHGSYSWGAVAENIAYGQTTASYVYNAWLEADADYSGQGHRRAMLSSTYNAIGIACVKINGTNFWVMELAYTNNVSSETAANDSETDVTATIALDYISSVSVSTDPESYTLSAGESSSLPSLTTQLKLTLTKPSSKSVTVTTDYSWETDDADIITINDDGTFTATGTGTASLSAAVLGATVTVPVTIEAAEEHTHTYGDPEFTWNDDYSACTASFTCTDNDDTQLIDCEVTSATTEATCETDGRTVYTAVCTFNGMDYTDTQTVTIHAAGHNYVDGTCTVCGESDPDAHTHSYTSEVTAEATCTEDGIITYTCSCGDSYTEVIPATGHTTELVNKSDATCTTDGYTGDTVCITCGETISAGEMIPAYGHTWNDGNVTEAATCTSNGTMTYTCTVCGSTKTESIAATGHTAVTDAAAAATCTADGLTEGSHCAVCGEILTAQETIPAAGHTWGEWVTIESATCEGAGYEQRTCSVCGTAETQNLDATGHDWEDGYTIDQEATCTTDGSKSIHCKNCDAVKDSTVIPATGHTTETVNAVSATCTSDGYTGDEICVTCGETVSTGTVIPAAGHVWDDGVVTKEAACEEDGIITYTCTACGTAKTEAIAAAGHTVVTDAAVAATCETAGLTEGSHCSTCGVVITAQEEIPATGHTTEIQNYLEATCENDGYTGDTVCTICGKTVSEGEVIPAYGHTWDDGVVTKEATCEEDGIITYTCGTCGTTKTETIAATGHTVVTDDAVAATCETSGLTEGSHCSTCGKVITAQEVIPATGHTAEIQGYVAATCESDGYTGDEVCITCGKTISTGEVIPAGEHVWDDGVITAEATCKEDGVITYTCTICGATKTEAIAAAGHKTEIQGYVAATCETDGYTGDSVCAVCGAVISTGEKIPAYGHTWNDGVITAEATCENDGTITYTCETCGTTKTEVIAAAGHTVVTDDAVAAACETTGLTEGSHCSVCGKVITEQEEIPALGHTTEIRNYLEATCESDGYTDDEVCSICGKTINAGEVIPASGHAWDDGIITVEPSCETEGTCVYTCSTCGSIKVESIAATGHTIVTDDAVAATCETTGLTEGSHCAVCGTVLVEQEVIPAAGHTTELQNYVAAACGSDGYTGDEVCVICGKTVSEGEVIPAGEHVWDDGVITAEATCEEDGAITYTCEVCGKTKTETLDAAGHTIVTDDAVAATCETTGLTEGSHCSTCGKILVEQEVIPALGHTTELQNYVAAACESDGYTGDEICSVCGKTVSKGEVIPATRHTWDEGVVTKEATETEDGEITYTCTECGETYTETIPAAGSSETEGSGSETEKPDSGSSSGLVVVVSIIKTVTKIVSQIISLFRR